MYIRIIAIYRKTYKRTLRDKRATSSVACAAMMRAQGSGLTNKKERPWQREVSRFKRRNNTFHEESTSAVAAAECGGALSSLCEKIRAAGLQGWYLYDIWNLHTVVNSLSHNQATDHRRKRCHFSKKHESGKSIESASPYLCTEYHTSLAYHTALGSR